jgi:hypothetical protein
MARLRIQHPLPGLPLDSAILNRPDVQVVQCEGRPCAIVDGQRVWLSDPPADFLEDRTHGR